MRGLGDTAYLAWMALRSRRLRTALATLGPLIGVLTIVATTTYSSSAAAQVDAALRQAGSDLVEVEAPQVPGENDPRLPAEALQRVLAVPGIESAAPLTRVSNATIAGNRLGGVQEAGALVINGTGPGLRAVAGVGLAQGRFLTASDENASAPVVVVGAKAAQILGVRPGIPQSVRIGDDDFGIVGVLTASTLTTVFDRSVFIPTSTARTILGVDPRPTSLMLRVDGDAVSHVVPALDRAITYGVGYPPRVMVPADLLRAQAEIDATLRWVILGTGGLALLVGGLGIANVLAMSVLERAPEIGVRRALGHSRGHVALQFVGEALLIGLLGGVIGAALAIGGVWAVISHRGWPLATSGPAIAAGILLGILVTALAALHPAVAAARMDPMRVLRPG
ncbi:MAG: ABC transporter permease [Tetrasphaera sp.]